MHIWLTCTLALAGAWAVVSDFKHRRISNYVTFGAAAVGLVIRTLAGGGPALLAGTEGWLVGLALLFAPFALGWMGAADVKLLAAFGALGGPEFVIQTALVGCITGGVMAIFYLIREHKLWFTLQHLYVLIFHPFGGPLEVQRRMPFGPALAAGAAVSLVMARSSFL